MFSNPFADDVVDDLRSSVGASELTVFYAAPFERLVEHLGELVHIEPDRRGRVIRLGSSRAGFGKTHLLSRARVSLEGTHLFVPLSFKREQLLDWEDVLVGAIDFLHASPEPPNGVSYLQAAARHLFASAVADLIRRGVVPCGNREEALESLRVRPVEMFDPAAADEAVARWFDAVFDTLLPSLGDDVCGEYGLTHGQSHFWLRRLYQYNRACAEGPGAADAALAGILAESAGDWRETSPEIQAREKFSSLMRMISRRMALVFVADHLDSFYGDQEGGLDLAGLLTAIPAMVPRSAVVCSVNVDVWDSVLGDHLPSASADRLSEVCIDLEGILCSEGEHLIKGRLAVAGIPDDTRAPFRRVLRLAEAYARRGEERLSPREVLRHARDCWERFAAGGYRAEEELGGAEEMEFIDFGSLPPDPAAGEVPPGGSLRLPPLNFLRPEGKADEAPEPNLALSAEPSPAVAPRRGKGGFELLLQRIRGREDETGRNAVLLRDRAADATEEHLLARHFDRLRAGAAQGGINGAIDLARVRRVIRTVGGLLPVLDQREVDLSGADGGALEWVYDENAVFFGFEASTNYPYWQALIEHVANRGGGAGAVKLVVFCPADQPMEAVSWTSLREVFEESAAVIDFVELDRETVAALYAGAELIEESEAGMVSFEVREIFVLLTRELDYLLRRLTRPLGGAVGAG